MRVLVLTPYPYGTVAGPRSSFELWERVLAAAGIRLEYAVFESEALHEVLYSDGRRPAKALEMARSYASFVPKALRGREYDAVLVNREATLIGPALIERWLAGTGTPLIYLLDDPLYIPYRSPSNGWLSYFKFFGKVRTLCRISRVVLANSPSNCEFARRHNGNVWEVPSVVDGDLYTGWRPRAAPETDVCVGWTGSASTAANLGVIRQPLRELSDRADVRIRLIGGGAFELPGVNYESIRWRAESEVEDLRTFDVGLVPLPRTQWTPHKFYLKLVQYMALGIPAVATPLGTNPIVIDDGVTGFLADSDSDWSATLARLVAEPGLREQIGRRAAEVARDRYTVQAIAGRVVEAFRSAIV